MNTVSTFFISSKKARASSLQKLCIPMLTCLLLISFTACSKYQSVADEFKCTCKYSRKYTFENGKKQASIYTIENLTINGHEIAMTAITTSENPFFIETKEYGKMKIKFIESKNGIVDGIDLLMTKEQRQKIRELK